MITPPAPKDRSASRPAAARIPALAAAAVCWLGCAVIAWLVLSGRTAPFDRAGLLFWRSGATLAPRGPDWLPGSVRALTALGDVAVRYTLAGGAAIALLAAHRRRAAAVFAATVLSGWAVEAAIKHLVGRARPQLAPHLALAGGPSFPSGHSFNAALVYIAMALALGALTPRRATRRALMALALSGSALVALSRVWLGVHYPSDALAGWLGGAGWAFTAAALFDRPRLSPDAGAAATATAPQPDA